MARRRVVIAGLGAITPIGAGAEGLWAGVRRGESAGRAITHFDPSPFASRIAAEIPDFDPLDYMEARQARRRDRFAQLAVAASRQALEQAGLLNGSVNGSRNGRNGRGVAVYLGSALGGIANAEEQHGRFLERGIEAIPPFLALSVFGGAGATNVAIEFGLTGPAMGNSNSCASGLIAIGEAFRLLQTGEVEIALAGGVEAPLAPLTFGAFTRIRALSTRNDAPELASRPFDLSRDGFLMAEGAAALVLETLEHAQARGVEPLAEVLGYAATNDAYHMCVPLPSGREAARAIQSALRDAGLGPSDIDYVNAHATATPLGDAAEARAIHLALGERAHTVPVSGTKGLHGHALGASPAIEVVITIQALRHGWIPYTANLTEADPECDLAHVPAGGLARRVDIVLKNAFGFGGINASLVLKRWGGG